MNSQGASDQGSYWTECDPWWGKVLRGSAWSAEAVVSSAGGVGA